MRGVILAGGTGTRLHPLTIVTNKHLLPVYKKPMIFYPLETLIEAGIKEILVVTSGEHIGHFFRLLGTGKKWGVRLHFEIQEGNTGTGAALLLAEEFVGNDCFLVILGDNVVCENVRPFTDAFEKEKENFKAKVLLAQVDHPEKYGVATIKDNRIVEIVEKPEKPISNLVNTGLWMFQPDVFAQLKKLKLSPRGEYEVTDILDFYAKENQLTFSLLQSEWTDAGSFESLFNATVLMKQLEEEREQKNGQ